MQPKRRISMDWITLILGLAGGGTIVGLIVGIFTIPSAIRKAKAEAKEPEIEAWKKLVDELQEENKELRDRIASNERRIDEMNSRIDNLYTTNGEWREENNQLKAEIAKLKIQIEADRARLCDDMGCPNRKSGC